MDSRYDLVIAGGGLAGLSTAILVARAGFSVLVLEKDDYPRHKVCGEYVSLESGPFLRSLGFEYEAYHLPLIKNLELTAPGGRRLTTPLDLGGIGVSRKLLDQSLVSLARQAGAEVCEQAAVKDISFKDDVYQTVFKDAGGRLNTISSRLAVGAFGKRSALDVQWKRSFLHHTRGPLNNFVGIKYHIKIDRPEELIALHNFRDGYCGISAVEEGLHCLCYLVRASELQAAGSIEALEQNTLSRNPYLRQIFEEAEKQPGFPLSISGIGFEQKEQVVQNVLMLGDAAGMITPLCGNGMSMALHTGKMAAELIIAYLRGKLSLEAMLSRYEKQWRRQFSRRLGRGRLIQRFFGDEKASDYFIRVMSLLPLLRNAALRFSHGPVF